jgi:hypothetical protein
MRYLIFAGIAALVFAGGASAETRDLSGFRGVAAADRIPVEITSGQTFRVEVVGGDAARVRTVVEGGVLRIRQSNRPLIGDIPRIDARVNVTMPALESVAASRGASVNAVGITANVIDLAASMGGAIDIDGQCQRLSAAASMGGSIDADTFECERAEVAASMGGSADVYASAVLDASASMGGSVTVRGEPAQRDVATSMGGSVSTR